MKLVFIQRLLAAAAFLAVGAAQASDLRYTGNIALSQDGVSAVSSSGIFVTTPTVVPAIAGGPAGGASNSVSYAPSTQVLSLNFSSWAADGGSLATLSASDSFVRFSRSIFNEDELLGSRSVFLTDFEFNLSQSTIYADVYARDLAGTVTSFGKTALLQADQPGIVGNELNGSLKGNLRITTAAADLIQAGVGLNLPAGSELDQLWRQANWGTASFSASAVPEPSSYALIGVGLMVVGAMARRRQAA